MRAVERWTIIGSVAGVVGAVAAVLALTQPSATPTPPPSPFAVPTTAPPSTSSTPPPATSDESPPLSGAEQQSPASSPDNSADHRSPPGTPAQPESVWRGSCTLYHWVSINWRQSSEDWDEFHIYRDGKLIRVEKPDRRKHQWTYLVEKPIGNSVFGVSAVKASIESPITWANSGRPICE